MESSRTSVAIQDSVRGFTLVEMMVVLAIISVITGIALLGQSTFNRSLLLTNTAYTVALSIREMQTLGLSSRAFNSVQNAGYGINLNRNTPASYILFADISNTPSPIPSNCVTGTAGTPEAKPGNCRYDTDATPDGIVQTYNFDSRFTVSRFCGRFNASTIYCSNYSAPNRLNSMDISFIRSNTETAVVGTLDSGPQPLTNAEIQISTADGQNSRYVCITRVGQVSVSLSACAL